MPPISGLVRVAGLLSLVAAPSVAADWRNRAVIVEIAEKVQPALPQTGCEQRIVYARVMHGGRIQLNWHETLLRGDLERRLEQMYRMRVERVLFVGAEPDVPFNDFIEVVSIAKTQVEHVAIVTPAVERKAGCWTFRRWGSGNSPSKE